MTVNFTIRPSETYIKKQMTLGIITTLIGVFAFFIGAGHIMGLGILFLVIASIQKKRDIIKIGEDNLEIKFAPLGATKFIMYSDLVNIERISEKKVIMHYKSADKTKKMRIPVQMIEPSELHVFLTLLETKINKAA